MWTSILDATPAGIINDFTIVKLENDENSVVRGVIWRVKALVKVHVTKML